MLFSPPFLDIDFISLLGSMKIFIIMFFLLLIIKIRPKMLQKRHLLLQLIRIVLKTMCLGNILTILPPLNIVEFLPIKVQDNLCGVIKENSSCPIWQDIAKPVFGGIIDPLLYPENWGFEIFILFLFIIYYLEWIFILVLIIALYVVFGGSSHPTSVCVNEILFLLEMQTLYTHLSRGL